MAAKKYVQSQTLYLAGSGVLIGATTITLTSLTDIYGNAITSIAAFGDKGYITLEPDTSNEEGATFTSVTVNANTTVTLGGISTILAQSPYTETSGLIRQHSGGTKVVITDNVGFWNTFGNKNNDETLLGRWGTSVVPTNASDLANKAYVDGVAVAGAPNASTTVKGIIEIATQVEVDARTLTGGTGALLVPTPGTARSTLLSDYVADTGTANTYAIAPVPLVSTYTAGQIFSFIALNANSGASTLNVAIQGAKNIFNRGAALIGGEILANQMVMVEYDGTQFQMVSPAANGLTATSIISQLTSSQTAAENLTAAQAVAVSFYQSDGGILIDTSTSAQGAASAGSKTIAFTVASNANRILVVSVTRNNTGGPSCAYNGVSMTRVLGPLTPAGGTSESLSIFTLVAPSTGANNLVITGLSGSEAVNYSIHSYYNAKQTSNPAVTASNISAAAQGSISASITPATAGALVYTCVQENGNLTTTFSNLSGNQQQIGSLPGNTGKFTAGDSYQLGPSAAITVSATASGGSPDWAIGTISIEPFTTPAYAVYKASSAAGSSYNSNQPYKSSSFIGFVSNSPSLGGAATIVLQGVVIGLSGLAAPSIYYLQDVAGTIGITPGTITRKIGIALSTTTLLITNEP